MCNCLSLDKPRAASRNGHKPYLVHVGWKTAEYQKTISRCAADLGLNYQVVMVDDTIFRTASIIKRAAAAVIWNGAQHYAPLARRLCDMRGIPYLFYEWGLLPQKDYFLVDPKGFCGDSILCSDLSWVTDEDMERLYEIRADLQKQYPLEPVQNRMLVVLQIENDSQILYHTPYNSMREFVMDIKEKFPYHELIVRPHPKSCAEFKASGVTVDRSGTLLDQARKAECVVGLTSTALYESAILGGPAVMVCGSHPLAIWDAPDHDKVLAGVLALRVRRGSSEMSRIFKRFGVEVHV